MRYLGPFPQPSAGKVLIPAQLARSTRNGRVAQTLQPPRRTGALALFPPHARNGGFGAQALVIVAGFLEQSLDLELAGGNVRFLALQAVQSLRFLRATFLHFVQRRLQAVETGAEVREGRDARGRLGSPRLVLVGLVETVHAFPRLRGFVGGVALFFRIVVSGGGGGAFRFVDEFLHLQFMLASLCALGFLAEGDFAVGDEVVEVFEEVFVLADEAGFGLLFLGEEGDFSASI